ncbi:MULTISPECIES: hypothetical protein [Mediterranea]|nr:MULTISPECIES: hypothetical protein [Mediterranea]MDM8122367.1 hypothetical protein [Mediterranea massiliensis]MDM8198806.1 hypothetical protein [Mediterranea massiliensis]
MKTNPHNIQLNTLSRDTRHGRRNLASRPPAGARTTKQPTT